MATVPVENPIRCEVLAHAIGLITCEAVNFSLYLEGVYTQILIKMSRIGIYSATTFLLAKLVQSVLRAGKIVPRPEYFG